LSNDPKGLGKRPPWDQGGLREKTRKCRRSLASTTHQGSSGSAVETRFHVQRRNNDQKTSYVSGKQEKKFVAPQHRKIHQRITPEGGKTIFPVIDEMQKKKKKLRAQRAHTKLKANRYDETQELLATRNNRLREWVIIGQSEREKKKGLEKSEQKDELIRQTEPKQVKVTRTKVRIRLQLNLKKSKHGWVVHLPMGKGFHQKTCQNARKKTEGNRQLLKGLRLVYPSQNRQ